MALSTQAENYKSRLIQEVRFSEVRGYYGYSHDGVIQIIREIFDFFENEECPKQINNNNKNSKEKEWVLIQQNSKH